VKLWHNILEANREAMRVPDSCTTFRFSTADVPEAARAGVVRELHLRERTVLPAGLEPLEPLEPLSDRPPHVDVIKRTLPGLALVSGTFSGLRHTARPRGAAGHGENDLLFCVNVHGVSSAQQGDRELILKDGEAFFATRAAAMFKIVRPTPARFIGIRVSREAVAALLGRLDDTPMSFVPHDTEAVNLLITYASAVVETLPLTTPELQRLAVSHIQELIAAAIVAARGGQAIEEGRGITAARLRMIMTDICAHLSDGGLSIADVAQRQRVTPRYVHKLFERDGLTFSSFVLGQRLARAHRILSDPRLADRTIGAIAFEVGFGDLSYFNRSFRRRYGATPGEIRRSSVSR
jgi:AraC-like DNA-binding protein